jgi:hypothetical protein
VDIDGQRHRFLFDTGGGVTCLAADLVAELGLHPYGRLTGHRQSGERVDLQRCDNVTLTIGGTAFTHSVVGVFDLMSLLPPAWERISGLVALNTFEGRCLSIDCASREFCLETARNLSRRTASMARVPMRIARHPAALHMIFAYPGSVRSRVRMFSRI